MHSTPHVLGLLIAVGIAGVAAACSSDDGKPNTIIAPAPAADAGDEAAASEGGAGEGGAGEGGVSEAGAKKPNAADCALPEECESGVCFVGNRQGYCAVACTPANATALCVPPFTGSCNNKGFCKRD